LQPIPHPGSLLSGVSCTWKEVGPKRTVRTATVTTGKALDRGTMVNQTGVSELGAICCRIEPRAKRRVGQRMVGTVGLFQSSHSVRTFGYSEYALSSPVSLVGWVPVAPTTREVGQVSLQRSHDHISSGYVIWKRTFFLAERVKIFSMKFPYE
jgi:hypothetical protein